MCSPPIQNVKKCQTSFEICANVFGSIMDPYKDLTWIRIWILYGSLCGSYMGRLYVDVFTTDPKCEYFSWNMCKCVRGSLKEPHGSLSGSDMDPYMDLMWIPMWLLYGSSICKCVHSWSKMLIFHLKYVQMCQGTRGSSGQRSGKVQGMFWEGSEKVPGRFGEGSGKPRGSQRQTPLWTFLWDSYNAPVRTF